MWRVVEKRNEPPSARQIQQSQQSQRRYPWKAKGAPLRLTSALRFLTNEELIESLRHPPKLQTGRVARLDSPFRAMLKASSMKPLSLESGSSEGQRWVAKGQNVGTFFASSELLLSQAAFLDSANGYLPVPKVTYTHPLPRTHKVRPDRTNRCSSLRSSTN